MEGKTKLFLSILVVVALLLVVKDLLSHPYTGPDLLPDPVQEMITPQTIEHVGLDGNLVEMTLVATYVIEAGVQSTKSYVTDGASSVSSKDLVLAWGDLNQEAIDAHITYSQSNRWYYYRMDDVTIKDLGYIARHSANTHIIPADKSIEKEIKGIKTHDYVRLSGYLAVVHFSGGDWGTSLTREDTGYHSCEVMYVTEVNKY